MPFKHGSYCITTNKTYYRKPILKDNYEHEFFPTDNDNEYDADNNDADDDIILFHMVHSLLQD